MGSKWPIVRLGDYIETCLGKMLDKEKNEGILHPYLGNKSVRWGSFDVSELSEMRFQDHEHEKYGLRYGDLVVCEGGEPGRCAIWKDEIPNMKFQKALHRIRPKTGLNAYYLLYWLTLNAKSGRLDAFFTGTTIKHLTGRALVELQLDLPPVGAQEAIAHILGTLDDKIELNRRMNETLESMAQALFKSWFVDFDPVIDNALAAGNPIPEPLRARAETRRALGSQRKPLPDEIQKLFPEAFVFDDEMGWIPDSWNIKKWGDIATLEYGKSLKGYRDSVGTVRVWGTNGPIGWCDTPLCGSAGIIIGRKGAYRGVHYSPNPFYVIDTAFYLRPMYPFDLKWAYYELLKLDINGMDSGSAIPSTSREDFYSIPVCVPPNTILEEFGHFLKAWYGKQCSNDNGSESLTKLRDTLLPKLLSGKLRIPDAEKLVADSL